jgi:hypothetical protein
MGSVQLTDKPIAKNIYILMMSASKERTRTSSGYVYYALQLYFSGLSLRRISIYQKKPCFHLELDPALQANEDIAKEMQTI